MDLGMGESRPVTDLVDEILEIVAEDAEALDCVEELSHAAQIARLGTSADRQLLCHKIATADGASDPEAFRAVVDQLIEETMEGI